METRTIVILALVLVTCVHIQTGYGQIMLRQRNFTATAQEVTIDVIKNQSVVFTCETFPTLNVRLPGSSLFGTNLPANLIVRGEVTTGLFTFEFPNVSQSDNGTAFQCSGGGGFTDIGVIIVLCQITLRQRNTSETAQEVTIDVIENQSVTFACATFTTINVRPPGSSTFGTNILDIVPNLIARGELTTGLFTFEFQNVTRSDNGTEFQCRGGQGFTDIGVIIVSSASPTPTQRPPGGLMVGDPHYSILLPNGQLLCFTVHGQSGFSFNLISNKQMHINALFVQDPKREEITWIGSLGVVVRGTQYKNSNITKLRFDASEKKIYIGDKVTLLAQRVERLTFSKGKLSIAEFASKPEHPVVHVDLQDVGLSLTVRFKRFHLDIIWNKVDKQPKDTHGLIGQFFREGIEIDESRKLLLLGPDMEPVPVMRKPVWSFMERETPEDQLCWAAMNPGYQGKRLIQGHYLDYLVDDVLSSDFKFGQPHQ